MCPIDREVPEVPQGDTESIKFIFVPIMSLLTSSVSAADMAGEVVAVEDNDPPARLSDPCP